MTRLATWEQKLEGTKWVATGLSQESDCLSARSCWKKTSQSLEKLVAKSCRHPAPLERELSAFGTKLLSIYQQPKDATPPKRPDKFTKTTPNKRGGCKHIDTFLTCCSRIKDISQVWASPQYQATASPRGTLQQWNHSWCKPMRIGRTFFLYGIIWRRTCGFRTEKRPSLRRMPGWRRNPAWFEQ